MADINFNRGDIVCLKSNPEVPMTVYNTTNFVKTHWLTKKRKLQTHEFLAAQLQLWEPVVKLKLADRK